MGFWGRKIRAVTVRTQPRRGAPDERAPAGMTRQVRLKAGQPDRDDRTRGRLGIAGAVLAAGFVLVAVRAVDVSLFSPEGPRETRLAASEPPRRAALTDRHGQLIAHTLDFYTAYADGQHIPRELIDDTVERLSSVVTGLDAERVARSMRARQRFIPIASDLTPRARQTIHYLGLPGVYFRIQPARVYTSQTAAAHVVGYAGRDMRGLSGAELAFDAELNDPSGRPVALSIDLTAQHRVESVLGEHMARHKAQGAAAILMRVGTGEILAMASLPGFNLNEYPHLRAPAGGEGMDPRFNRASLGVYELGSVFKPLALAAGLESGKVTLEDRFDVRQPLRVGGHSIDDFRGQRRVLTAREVIIHSSNIGSARMAEQITGNTLRGFYEALRLHERAPVELTESGRPRMPRSWGPAETMTASYGHGLAVSPLALTSAYAALANGGVYVPPTLRPVAPGEIIAGETVMSARTSAQVLAVMRETVARSRRGGPDVEGLAVAGKTGTALQAGPGGYDRDHRVTTFVAVFPFDDPQYVLTVSFDRPRPSRETHNFATAGWNAAPAAGDILRSLAGVLDLRRRDADPSARAEHVASLFTPRARADIPAEEPVPLQPARPQP
ncbi:penicillin-binding protein 2 [Alkalicaulis satelles]|uniref:Penicillin-binding protein 2 n=1 Tax=Alkalicaulis satelles TaxID=2609175 RepID=A0A5M6ZKE0_9PROT|nr:penicillin-binding protein 2 [Alkalicaulis satelles]KAA5805296.1 penicillin-binding protein 2 [Alkalicaulis satelles]